MNTVLFACECGQSFNYHVPQKDGDYQVHCPNCVKKLQNIVVFDAGRDYEATLVQKEPETRYYVVELAGGKFLLDNGDEQNTLLYSVDTVWESTLFPHSALPSFEIGHELCIDNEGVLRIVVAVHEAFIHLAKANHLVAAIHQE